jgi:hypothetical protein
VRAARPGNPLDMADRTERKLAGSGVRFVTIGVPLLIIGIVIALLLDGTARGIGAAIAVFGAIPIVVGVTLMLSAALNNRSRHGTPYT